MGNRAVITTRTKKLGIYLHWNGGRDSVEAFLKYCELRHFRSPDKDSYGWARLCQVIANFFGEDGLSIGIDSYVNLDIDNGDNGVYIIEDWKIVDREYFNGCEQRTHELPGMLKAIDDKQPVREQIFEDLVYEDIEELLNKELDSE